MRRAFRAELVPGAVPVAVLVLALHPTRNCVHAQLQYYAQAVLQAVLQRGTAIARKYCTLPSRLQS